MRICPSCITELVPNRKKIGGYVNWLVCPDCGHRVRQYTINFERETYVKTRKRNNNLNLDPFSTTLP